MKGRGSGLGVRGWGLAGAPSMSTRILALLPALKSEHWAVPAAAKPQPLTPNPQPLFLSPQPPLLCIS